MSLIPEKYRQTNLSFHFTPLIDFLFIIVAVFALFITTKKNLYQTQVNLIKHDASIKNFKDKKSSVLNLGISASGLYQFLDREKPQTLETIQMVKQALFHQIEQGNFPSDPRENHIFLHIDQKAEWSVIGTLLLALHQEGFIVYPIYENKKESTFPAD